MAKLGTDQVTLLTRLAIKLKVTSMSDKLTTGEKRKSGRKNDMINHTKFWLVERELSPFDVGFKLNEMPMSAIDDGKTDGYGIPREAFKLLADRGKSTLPDE